MAEVQTADLMDSVMSTPSHPDPEPDFEAETTTGSTDPERPPRFEVPLELPKSIQERRKAGRVAVEQVECDIGTVIDLSASGARLHRPGRLKPDSNGLVSLAVSDGECGVMLEATIVREVKLGWRRWEYGLQFVDVGQDARRVLTLIASTCRHLSVHRPAS